MLWFDAGIEREALKSGTRGLQLCRCGKVPEATRKSPNNVTGVTKK